MTPSEQIVIAVETARQDGLKILLPKVISRDGAESVYGACFFEYEENRTVKSPDRRLIGCCPLGAVIYALTDPLPKTRGQCCALASYMTAANYLGVDWDWVRGFSAGYNRGISGIYVPREDFNLRTHFNAEAFDFGYEMYQKVKG